MKNTALVVIDLQNDITKNYKEIIAKVNDAIDWAVQKNLWVVYIQRLAGQEPQSVWQISLLINSLEEGIPC